MKKRTFKNLSLGKKTISNLENNVFGGAPTTDQSQYCPEPIPLPWTITVPHSLDEKVCITRSCDSDCYSRCNGC
ncbi:hypothetical protein C8N46_103292 [Kordia periserrulae]|uniref:Uncharacterized protein n=1 Tax=Kordia periserrulae TaxID=701523 RepID=A0A2T6C1J4_9FLAO|nr:hypothetical protein [Kordia periserrulae]PTX62193.1 hypothetical protein C8N46_103292 [Kordia periserrulae]